MHWAATMNEAEVWLHLISMAISPSSCPVLALPGLQYIFLIRRPSCSLLQVEKQIDQMVRFIKQEAEEKANEIGVSAEEVCPWHIASLLCNY